MRLAAEVEGKRLEFPVRKQRFVVGRSAGCDITIVAPTLSRRHLEVTVEDDNHIAIRDLGTRNGTFVGDEQVTEAEIQPGQIIRLGKMPVVFLADQPGAAAAMRPIDEELEGAREHEGADEPTPVDQSFAPGSALPATVGEGGKLVPTEPGAAQGRKRLKLVLMGAGVFLLVVTVALLALSRGRPPVRLTRAQYAGALRKAVALYRNGNADAGLQLLKKVRNMPSDVDTKTAQILIEAITADRGLASADTFKDVWTEAEKRWKELSEDSATPPYVRKLGEERTAWIGRESQNMYAYSDFLEHFEKKNWQTALRKAEAIAPDSLFRRAADDKVLQVRDNLADDLKREADQAFDGRQWQRAFSRYETYVKFLDETTPEIRSRMQECVLSQRESQAVTRAETFVNQQRYAEAATAIRAVRPSGPYAQELKSLQQRIGLGTAQMQARTAYDSGRADDALEILGKVGETTGNLYNRIRAVKKTWGDAEAAMKKAEFAKAQAAGRSILAMEPNEQNYFRREAQKLLASWQDQAATMAMRLVTRGQDSWREKKFSQARRFFEEARRVDPKGQQGIQQVRELKKEALLEFNKALNVKGTNSAEAVRIFREVKARLLPEDVYYNEADAWIRKLTGAK